MSSKSKITALMIFKIIAFIFGTLIWFVGFSMFNSMKGGDFGSGLLGWFIWGFVTLFSMPVEAISFLIKGAREGAIEGANTYKIRDYGSSFTISNSPGAGTFKGIVTSAIAFILIGPITLALKVLTSVLTIIDCILALRKINSETNGN